MSSLCVHGFPLCGPVAGGSAGHSLGSRQLASEAFRCLLPIGSRKLTKKCLSEPYGRSGRKGTRSDRVTRQLANRAAISGAGVGSRRPGRRGSRPWIEAVAAPAGRALLRRSSGGSPLSRRPPCCAPCRLPRPRRGSCACAQVVDDALELRVRLRHAHRPVDVARHRVEHRRVVEHAGSSSDVRSMTTSLYLSVAGSFLRTVMCSHGSFDFSARREPRGGPRCVDEG